MSNNPPQEADVEVVLYLDPHADTGDERLNHRTFVDGELDPHAILISYGRPPGHAGMAIFVDEVSRNADLTIIDPAAGHTAADWAAARDRDVAAANSPAAATAIREFYDIGAATEWVQ